MQKAHLSLEEVDVRFNKCLKKAIVNNAKKFVKGEITDDELS